MSRVCDKRLDRLALGTVDRDEPDRIVPSSYSVSDLSSLRLMWSASGFHVFSAVALRSKSCVHVGPSEGVRRIGIPTSLQRSAGFAVARPATRTQLACIALAASVAPIMTRRTF